MRLMTTELRAVRFLAVKVTFKKQSVNSMVHLITLWVIVDDRFSMRLRSTVACSDLFTTSRRQFVYFANFNLGGNKCYLSISYAVIISWFYQLVGALQLGL